MFNVVRRLFPYFFVGTFIEALLLGAYPICPPEFPYFFVGTFIEAGSGSDDSLASDMAISLLFRRDFH